VLFGKSEELGRGFRLELAELHVLHGMDLGRRRKRIGEGGSPRGTDGESVLRPNRGATATM
jgi:hypothetical protein